MSDTSRLVPSVEEVLERTEITTELKRNMKFLNADNSWNKQGMLEAFNDREDEMTKCSASGVPLFYVSKSGQKFMIESFGFCISNRKPYHIDHLALGEDMAHTSYPVEYEGCMSLEEWNKPLSEKELAEIHNTHKM